MFLCVPPQNWFAIIMGRKHSLPSPLTYQSDRTTCQGWGPKKNILVNGGVRISLPRHEAEASLVSVCQGSGSRRFLMNTAAKQPRTPKN